MGKYINEKHRWRLLSVGVGWFPRPNPETSPRKAANKQNQLKCNEFTRWRCVCVCTPTMCRPPPLIGKWSKHYWSNCSLSQTWYIYFGLWFPSSVSKSFRIKKNNYCIYQCLVAKLYRIEIKVDWFPRRILT